MKRLLIPTDFSNNATVAAKFGIELFQDQIDNCIILNTYNTPHAGASMLVSIEDILKSESVAGLKMEASKLKDWFGERLKLELSSEKGDLVSAVIRAERHGEFDFVIMGTKGADNIQDKVFGSNTWQVVERIKSPVLVVPDVVKTGQPNKVMLSTDLSGADPKSLTPLLEILKTSGAHLDVVHISDGSTSEQEYFQGALSTVNHSFHTIFGTDGDVVQELTDFADNNDIDMLAMVHHKKGFFEKFFTQSTTRSMALATEMPLLVLRD